jgi:UDP-glucuronate 4-epimerase
MKMKTYIVTGGAGFIGSTLVEKLLLEGNKVINIDNFNDYYDLSIKIENVLESVGYTGSAINNVQLKKEERLEKLKKAISSDNYHLEIVDIRDIEELDRIFYNNKIDCVINLAYGRSETFFRRSNAIYRCKY